MVGGPADLEGRVALITGSASGIGAETARLLARSGASVVINSRSSVSAGEEIASEVHGIYLQADVSDPGSARRLVADTVDRLGRLDILVNSAGTTRVIPHEDLEAATPEIWTEILATNVIAPFVLVSAAAPFLRRAPGGGVVVNVGSRAGIRPGGSSIPYGASKAALHHLTVNLAVALGPDIRVNAVAPGLVDTPWSDGWDAFKERVRELSPMRRVITAAEVARVILAQITSEAVTGDVWVVDGGFGLVR
jgi:ketoreductase RED2